MFDLDECIHNLWSPYYNVRRAALSSLNARVSVSPHKYNIRFAVPMIARFLSDREDSTCAVAASILHKAAGFWDISPAEAALTKALTDFNRVVKAHAFGALASHYLYQKNWAILAEWLERGDPGDVSFSLYASKECASWSLTHDISPLLPALGKALIRPDPQIPEHAAVAIIYTYMNTGNAGALEELLRFPSAPLALSQRLIFTGWVDNLPLECLERLQLLLERSFAAWLPKGHSLPDYTIRIARLQAKVTYALQTVTKFKAGITKKNDGELLHGETIALPQNRRERGMYHTARRSC